MSNILIGSVDLRIALSPIGAELVSVRDRIEREWLWQGDAASWLRRAPVLFPVIGQSRGGVVRHDGSVYPMPSHGFAPVSPFEIASVDGESCTLILKDDAGTRLSYPFSFLLQISFEVCGKTLVQRAEITNTGDVVLPYSFGFHPGFQWPLPTPSAIRRNDHHIHFQADEPYCTRRITEDGLGPATSPSPVADRVLSLSDQLFAEGAVVLDGLQSRAFWFGVPGDDGVLIEVDNLPHLGIWTRTPATYLCIEPWQGYADPIGFDGDLIDKPGSLHLAPGRAFTHTMRITFGEAAPVWNGLHG